MLVPSACPGTFLERPASASCCCRLSAPYRIRSILSLQSARGRPAAHLGLGERNRDFAGLEPSRPRTRFCVNACNDPGKPPIGHCENIFASALLEASFASAGGCAERGHQRSQRHGNDQRAPASPGFRGLLRSCCYDLASLRVSFFPSLLFTPRVMSDRCTSPPYVPRRRPCQTARPAGTNGPVSDARSSSAPTPAVPLPTDACWRLTRVPRVRAAMRQPGPAPCRPVTYQDRPATITRPPCPCAR